MEAQLAGQIVGGVVMMTAVSSVFFWLLRRMSSQATRAVLAVGIAFVLAGVLNGLGAGRDSFESRVETMLTGVGFASVLIPGVIVLIGFLIYAASGKD